MEKKGHAVNRDVHCVFGNKTITIKKNTLDLVNARSFPESSFL
jgi:hypothetical protein